MGDISDVQCPPRFLCRATLTPMAHSRSFLSMENGSRRPLENGSKAANPATGELLATVAEGDAEDINRAVAAARKAFEGPWSKFSPYERQNLLLKLADLVEQKFRRAQHPRHARYGSADPADAGLTPAGSRHAAMVCGPGDLHPRRDNSELAAGRDILLHAERADRVVGGAIIPWNGPLGASIWKIGPALATGAPSCSSRRKKRL